MRLAPIPFLRITAALILGIIANTLIHSNNFSLPYSNIFTGVFFLAYFFLGILAKNPTRKKWHGRAGLLCFVLLGNFCSQLTLNINKPSLLPDTVASGTYYTATINSKPSLTSRTTKYTVGIKEMFREDKWVNMHDDAILYFEQKMHVHLDYGDKLLIKGHPEFVENQKNPYAFDYALFLQRRGIYLQDFVSNDDFIIVNENHADSPRYLSLSIGDYFERILAKYILSERELSMVKAMLIGRRDTITPEMEYAYASTGTAHILAVSGLHVGIIYLLFTSALQFLKRTKLRLVYYGINLCAIWSFAFITGFSPSAQRAATMLTFVIFAELSNRKSSIYNTILASIFFILLLSPNLLFSVSFQLSCSAVLGIVYCYKKIYSLFYVRNKVFDFFWKITVLSISAQIATFPLTIYYFHQFPTLFPFTNLIAIPTASVVIFGGLLLLIASPFTAIPLWIGKFISGWVYFYNELMLQISQLSFATIENLYLAPLQVVLIIICTIFLLRFLDIKKLYLFRYFTLALLLLSGWTIFDRLYKSQQHEIIFYHSNKSQYFDIFRGKNCFTNIDLKVNEQKQYVKYNIDPARKRHLITNIYGLKKLDNVAEFGDNILIHWNKKVILILNELQSLTTNNTDISIDYLIIGREIIPDLANIKKMINVKNLILDSTIDRSAVEKVYEQLNGSDINIHSIQSEGAYKISI